MAYKKIDPAIDLNYIPGKKKKKKYNNKKYEKARKAHYKM